jgi:hypothetical protein
VSTPRPDRHLVRWAALPLAVLLAGGAAWTSSRDRARPLPFGLSDGQPIIAVAHAVKQEFGGRGLPIVANPDLGKLSFQKEAIIVDLGFLGDPVLTRIWRKQPPPFRYRYLSAVAMPDVVELHGAFACRDTPWLASPEFQRSWKLSDEHWLAAPVYRASCAAGGRYAIWIRSDADAEYALTREVATASDPAAVVRKALDTCRDASDDPFRCQHVRRAVQREAEVLRRAGKLGATVKALRSSPSASFDIPMVSRGRGWADKAYEAFLRLDAGR